MARHILALNEKPLHWVGSSKRDLLAFPKAVIDDFGNALGIAQFGGTAPTAKAWKGLGAGVLEVVESHDGSDVDLVAQRLKAAATDHEEHYGKSKD